MLFALKKSVKVRQFFFIAGGLMAARLFICAGNGRQAQGSCCPRHDIHADMLARARSVWCTVAVAVHHVKQGLNSIAGASSRRQDLSAVQSLPS